MFIFRAENIGLRAKILYTRVEEEETTTRQVNNYIK